MLKLFPLALLFLLLAPKTAVPPNMDLARLAAMPQQYSDSQGLLQGEFARLKQQINVANATALYGAYQTGRPLLRAAFRDGDPDLRRDIVGHAAGLIRALPDYEALLNLPAPDPVGRAVDSGGPLLRAARVRLAGTQPLFDGLAMPDKARLYRYKVFPLRDGDRLRINTGNIQQFGRYLSTLLRLAASDRGLAQDRAFQRDVQTIARYLARDFLIFFWREAPAWHWNGAFEGGMRERSLARLDGGERVAGRRFFAGFLDYDLHVMTVAADVAEAQRQAPWLGLTASEQANVDDVVNVAFRVITARAQTGADDLSFSFDRGYWDDNPIAQFAGCQDRRVPRRPCPISNYTVDVSHAQRWPAWLESLALVTRNDSEARMIGKLRSALGATVARNIRYRSGQVLLPNFLDGRDGWFLTTESVNGANAHPPSSMTGWAMRYGALAELAPMQPEIAAAQRSFCRTIASTAPADVQFRMANYGEPEANPANGLRPMRDEYGPFSVYSHICTMTERLMSAPASGPRAIQN